MELVYLWVEEYKNIHNQGFNFSPKFNCDYDPDTNELTIDENDDCIENFFGENINVTAIVGKNGSGKSSIFECLQAINIINPIQGDSNFDSKYILILNIDKDDFLEDNFLSVDKNIQITSNIEKLNYNKLLGELFYENIDFLFESLFFDAELPYNKFNEYDMASENFNAIPEFEHTKEYVYVDLDYNSISKKLLQINETYLLNTLDFIPEKVTISQNKNNLMKSRNFIVYDYHKRPRFSNEIIEKVDEIIETIIGEDEFFIFSLFLSHIDNFEKKEILAILNKISSSENIVEVLKPHLKKFHTELNFDEYKSILAENIKINKVDKALLIKYFEYLDIEILDSKSRNFYNLSHGEKMFFGLMVNISYFIQESRSESFLLCFDEPDLSLHPMWQKNYMKEIINLCKQFDKKIHLVFTTHSPFLLSDIPKQNIIFLDTDEEGKCKVVDGLKEKKQTFGANIHTLLSDSFFMEDGLMGEFAKGKIDKAIRLLNQEHLSDEELKYCEQIISIIGEPIVKNQLQRMLDSKRLKKIDEIDAIKSSMEAMQKRLDELEK